MADGKIPLLAIESLSIVRQFRCRESQCLVAFLHPPSQECHERRLRTWLSETSHALSLYAVSARQQARQVLASGIYDMCLINRKVNEAVEEVHSFAKQLRPDLFKDVSTGRDIEASPLVQRMKLLIGAVSVLFKLLLSISFVHVSIYRCMTCPYQAAGEDCPLSKEPWRAVRVIFLAGHPELSHTSQVADRLCQLMPFFFVKLPVHTTAKAGPVRFPAALLIIALI